VLEAVVAPDGVPEAVHVLSSTMSGTEKAGRALREEAVARIQATRYERTTVYGVGAYVCLPVTVRFEYK